MLVKMYSGFLAAAAILLPSHLQASSSGVAAPRYQLVDIHTIETSGSLSMARGMNNLGHVIGEFREHGGVAKGFFWTPEAGMQLLPETDPQLPIALYGLNDHDEILGSEGPAVLLWNSAGPPTELKSVIGPSLRRSMYFNDQEQFIVEVDVGNDLGGIVDAFWSPSSGVLFPDPPRDHDEKVTLHSINNAGTIAGAIQKPSGGGTAFLWDIKTDSYTPLPTPNADVFAATGIGIDDVWSVEPWHINERGDVMLGVGITATHVSGIAGIVHFADGKMSSLGSTPIPDGVPNDVYTFVDPGFMNNHGLVVGRGGVYGEWPYPQFDNTLYIWDRHNGIQLLEDLLDESADGWKLTAVTAVNDRGHIAGWGRSPSGSVHAFVLVPVPEPTALHLIMVTGTLAAIIVLTPTTARTPQNARHVPAGQSPRRE
jgi:uncharacterized membrane protein